MDDVALARAIHVAAVVLWIGGVGFVTTVLLPSVRASGTPETRVALFEALEGRFSWQARATTLLTGASGLYLVEALDAWERFGDPTLWWMHAMVLVWLLFTVALFVAEPLVLRRWYARTARENPDGTLRLIARLHVVALTLSLITVLGAVGGSHGLTP